jgi:hypothetical protein
MEMHAHVPKIGKTGLHWLLEAVFIVASVGLGFAVAQIRESRADHELVERVLDRLQAEVEQNLAILEPQIAAHRRWMDALAQSDSASGSQTAFDFMMAVRPTGVETNIAPLRHAAWDTAVATGALRLIDYDIAAVLSEIYGAQTTTYDSLGRMVTSAIYMPAMFDGAMRRPAIQVGRYVITEVEGNERYLRDLYQKHLPVLRNAAAAARE